MKTELENALKKLYGNDERIFNYQKFRYNELIEKFNNKFGNAGMRLYSSPGRIEIGGNHTDHNNGRVLAASINLDSVAVAAKNNENIITIYSDGYENPFVVNLKNPDIDEKEIGTTSALIRGIAFRFNQLGFRTGGFNAYITSDVLPGSGLSSSASIEVLIGTILNNFYNNDKIEPVEIAKIGQFAENIYFGKPCGLMDQTACAVGGIISIDFEDPQNPVVEKINYDFAKNGYDILVIDTGGNHADLTGDYAAIPMEMKAVAKFFRKNVLREISLEMLLENLGPLRSAAGDRAILRAIHFLMENERVPQQISALKTNDLKKFFSLVSDSGNSSFKLLQNIYSNKNVKEQGVSLALVLTENFISQSGNGACRVHGGGFAGTVLVFLHSGLTQEYKRLMEKIFGDNCVKILSIRNTGGQRLI